MSTNQSIKNPNVSTLGAVKNSREQKQTDDPARAARVDNLLRPEALAAFDRTAFEHDGYWVWEGILTDAGRKQFTASLQKLQHMNDCILMDTDWAAINFEARGLAPPPPEQITPEFLESCCGGSEQMPSFLRSETRAYMYEHGLLRSGSSVSHTQIQVAGSHAGIFPGWI